MLLRMTRARQNRPPVRNRDDWHADCSTFVIMQPQQREDAMNTFAPEFAQLWLAGTATTCAVELAPEQRDDEADRERAALEELADRVSAARSII
jgi:hypothetical protein